MKQLIHASLFLMTAASPALAQAGWSAPTLLTALNSSASDASPHLSADGLTLHFASYRAGDWEIFSTTRSSRTAPWGAPVQETALGTASTEDNPFLTADGLEIYFASTQPGGAGGFDLLVATRPSPGAPWGTPAFETALNGSGSESAPSLTADKLELYMLTTSFGAPYAPQTAIFRSTRTSTSATWSTPTLVTELSNPNTHRDVNIAPDGLSIVYTEYIPAPVSRIRVLRATRTKRADPFGTPVALAEFDNVGTLQGVFGASPSADGLEMILAAGFSTSAGSQELMVSRFDGLTQQGIAGYTAPMALHYRDSARPMGTYLLALALGDTGFPLSPTQYVPIDLDLMFLLTLGQDLPPFTTGFGGMLDQNGEGLGTLSGPHPLLAGLHVFAAGFTFDVTSPTLIAFVSNAIEIEFQ